MPRKAGRTDGGAGQGMETLVSSKSRVDGGTLYTGLLLVDMVFEKSKLKQATYLSVA